MKVQEALKSEDVYIFDINQPFVTQEQKFKYWEESKAEIKRLKSALSDIEKCEPVNTHDYAYLVEEAIQRSVSNSSQPLRDLGVYLSKLLDEDQWSTAEQYLLKAALTTHQPIEKCEPVAEALHERNRLGYAVVGVIGTLDEIIENAQEVEVDDFLHIAIPIDKWHELQDALEEMPKRAELYTSPKPIDKCEPVYLIVSGADEIVVTKEKYDSWTSAKRISYTSPISKEWVGLSDQQIQNLIINSDNYNKFQFIKSVEHTVKQINAPEKG